MKQYPAPFRGTIGSPWRSEVYHYNCPVHVAWRDPETGRTQQRFIADARGLSLSDAAAKAAAVANAMAAYLNSCCVGHNLRGDGYALAQIFRLPHKGLEPPRRWGYVPGTNHDCDSLLPSGDCSQCTAEQMALLSAADGEEWQP